MYIPLRHAAPEEPDASRVARRSGSEAARYRRSARRRPGRAMGWITRMIQRFCAEPKTRMALDRQQAARRPQAHEATEFQGNQSPDCRSSFERIQGEPKLAQRSVETAGDRIPASIGQKSARLRTASAMRARSGSVACSRGGLNGMGQKCAPTRTTGASSAVNSSPASRAATSAATPNSG
jgi:hypothetical protein